MMKFWPSRTRKELLRTSALLVLLVFTVWFVSGLRAFNPGLIYFRAMTQAPERYDGKMISVVGFLSIESEDARLYLGQEAHRRNNMGNGIFIDANKEVTSDIETKDLHYVGLVGVFRQKGLPMHYPGGAGDAGITDIRQCLPIPELTEARPRRLKN